jgi:dCMP deaminase
MLEALGIFKTIWVLEYEELLALNPGELITADEALSRKVIEKYFPKAETIYDGTVFLRYDENNVKTQKPVNFDRQSDLTFDRAMMVFASRLADKSSDWWRHVGAVLVKDGLMIAHAHNEPVLSPHMPYVLGNPRDYIPAGTLSHFSDTLHSEKGVFAQLLMDGVSTRGADLYVSVFPCPDCAKLIAYSGIKRCFFGSGHASLDGEQTLKGKGVELVYVPLPPRV